MGLIIYVQYAPFKCFRTPPLGFNQWNANEEVIQSYFTTSKKTAVAWELFTWNAIIVFFLYISRLLSNYFSKNMNLAWNLPPEVTNKHFLQFFLERYSKIMAVAQTFISTLSKTRLFIQIIQKRIPIAFFRSSLLL